MKSIVSVLFGLAAYAVFFETILYTIGFVGNVVVAKSIDVGPPAPVTEAVAVDLLLVGLFAVQHSVMARSWFKRAWTRFVPASVERSTFVLFSSLVLLLLFWQWRPIPASIWIVTNPAGAVALEVVFWVGWGVLFVATFLINHFELFGLRQAFAALLGLDRFEPVFRTPLLYRRVRHPIYLGFLLSFWSTPRMTAGHLLFSIATTGYILLGIRLEEHDLIRIFGDRYRRYRAEVGMLLPSLRRHSPDSGDLPADDRLRRAP